MPVFDLAHLLVAFQIVYVKILCIFTTICLGPWTGISIYHSIKHPPDDDESKKQLFVLISTILLGSVYIVTLFLLAVPENQKVLLLWLISCIIAIVGHWIIYFVSFSTAEIAFKSSLEEWWLPLAVLTIVFLAVYALPLFYIYFINCLTGRKPNHSEEPRRTRADASCYSSNVRREGFAEVMQLPNSTKWNIQNNSSFNAKYEDYANTNKNICDSELKTENTSVNTVLLPKT